MGLRPYLDDLHGKHPQRGQTNHDDDHEATARPSWDETAARCQLDTAADHGCRTCSITSGKR